MALDEELKRAFSDYLCTECKKPLYFELNSKEEVCVNPKCILRSPLLGFHDVSQANVLKKQMKDKESKLKLRIIRSDRRSFIRFLHQQRRAIAKELIAKGRVQFEKLLSIDEMLILTNSLNLVGRERSLSSFTKILKGYEQFFSEQNFIEDIENLRVLLSLDKNVYMLKYWDAVMELYRSYGIIPGRQTDLSTVFRYAKIDQQAKVKVEFQFGMDLAKLFEQQFDHITALKYVFERHYRTSKQHRYDPTGLDIASLLGLFFSVKSDVEYWSREPLRRHYERTVSGKGDFEHFVHEYATSKENAPLIVFDGTSFIFDKETLLFYIPYLIGQNRRKVEGQIATGEEKVMKKKQEAAAIFEDHVRSHLKKRGFTGPEKPLVISERNEKHEYDIIGIKENSQEIVLVEAKYRDLSPSSLAGKTLVQQELLDEDNGLLAEAVKHQARLNFFDRYRERFKRELSLESLTDQYHASAWIVTKHPPLISKYRQVSIIVFDKFCEDSFQILQGL